MADKTRVQGFVEEIWCWYREHKRSLPWRDLLLKNEDERAYRILVSEVMLQQTQVSRVTIIYKRFLEQFPTLKDLAHTSNREVILAWRGMGYNSRALRLRDAARIILQRYRGKFPKDMEELMSIPGIGRYTAAAIRNFAFHLPTPCIETNIRRVLHTAFFGPPKVDGTWRKDDRQLLKLAEEVLSEALMFSSSEPRKSGANREAGKDLSTQPVLSLSKGSKRTADWHAALMDYGSLAIPRIKPKKKLIRKEPGRLVGSTFVPNRIFRGKIVEELRDNEWGLSLLELGRRVCIDWEPKEHQKWLRELLEKLEKDNLIQKRKEKFVLCP